MGSVPGTGGDPIFDLDGKAAEWAVGSDSAGEATGPSADRSTDPASTAVPSPACACLRVVVGPEPACQVTEPVTMVESTMLCSPS